jgi:hypothetical protein
MRELNVSELNMVAGGGDQCTPGNSIGGITDSGSLGQDLINVYEGLVQATSYIIERVANAFG